MGPKTLFYLSGPLPIRIGFYGPIDRDNHGPCAISTEQQAWLEPPSASLSSGRLPDQGVSYRFLLSTVPWGLGFRVWGEGLGCRVYGFGCAY